MYTGVTGKVCIGTTTATEVAYISNWSIEDTSEVIEVTQLGKKYKTKLAGLGSWSASADGAIEFSTISGHKALFDAMHKGTKIVCEFYLDTNEDAPIIFSGKGLIESLSIDLSAEDKGNISISISGCGELNYPGNTNPTELCECNKPE